MSSMTDQQRLAHLRLRYLASPEYRTFELINEMDELTEKLGAEPWHELEAA